MTDHDTLIGFDGASDDTFLVVAHRQPDGHWRIADTGLDTPVDAETLIAALPHPEPRTPEPQWGELIRDWLDRFAGQPITVDDWQRQVLALQYAARIGTIRHDTTRKAR